MNPVKNLKAQIFFVLLAGSCMLTACKERKTLNAALPEPAAYSAEKKAGKVAAETRVMSNAADILARPEVPILCYHQVRDWRASDSKRAKDYIVPVSRFRDQMKQLADSGYQTILPDQLFDYLAYGTPLPEKPVMLTFDDTDLDQYTVAYPEMKKYGFKGVFFIMTVSIGKPRYMNAGQIRELADAGHVIGSHTWDHRNVKKFVSDDWETQVDKPSAKLKEITGRPVEYFAYPFGLWNPEAIPFLKERGFKAAFQLSANRDLRDPLHSVRRIIVPGQWSTASMFRAMQGSFN
jgi:peptidoglycan/xylan/chitin deacetylase (PgdA/CDA1 family)